MVYARLVCAVVKTQIRPVPDELRMSMSQALNETVSSFSSVSSSSTSSITAASEGEAPLSEDRGGRGSMSDHPYDVLVQSRVDLETYILILQVRTREKSTLICSGVASHPLNQFLKGALLNQILC